MPLGWASVAGPSTSGCSAELTCLSGKHLVLIGSCCLFREGRRLRHKDNTSDADGAEGDGGAAVSSPGPGRGWVVVQLGSLTLSAMVPLQAAGNIPRPGKQVLAPWP